MAARPQQLIRYLRACLRADNRERAIRNIFGPKILHREIIEGEELLLTDVLDRIAVDSEWAEGAAKAAGVYRREKSLLYCSLLLVGRPGIRGLPPWLAAPLVFAPAELDLEGEDGSFLRVDLASAQANVPVLSALAGAGEREDVEIEPLLRVLLDLPLQPKGVHRLVGAIAASLPQVDGSALYTHPRLLSKQQVSSLGRRRRLACLPASLVALVPNPSETRGVLFELGQLKTEEPSRALDRLLSGGAEEVEKPGRIAPVPIVLSSAQEKALQAAARFDLSFLVGPPGTGKSFTLAAVALEHLARGRSVLIATRTAQALDVMEDKVLDLLGSSAISIRAGRGRYLRDLKTQLRDLLQRGPPEANDLGSPRRLGKRLRQTEKALRRLESRLLRREKIERAWGSSRVATSFGNRIQSSILSVLLQRSPPYGKLCADYEKHLSERCELASRFVRSGIRGRLKRTLERSRPELQAFLSALRARTSSRQERLFEAADLDTVFGAFPLWLVRIGDLSRVLPLRRELFDLVLVDEATHCDMASVLPVFQRARRAMVAGDPRQLRHLSFLANTKQRQLAEENALHDEQRRLFDYRSTSLIDLVDERLMDQRQVVFLDEHYRSRPEIIAFSNREFYADRLRVMTERPGKEDASALCLRRVDGKRHDSGVNREECEALVNELMALMTLEQPGRARLSLGILSPFRDQVELLQAEVSRRLTIDQLDDHDLLVGTPYAFQGEERDVMLISLALDDDSHASAFRHIERADVLNVALTRARSRQLVYASFEPDRLPRESRVRRFLKLAGGSEADTRESSTLVDGFADEVRRALEARGCRVWSAYEIAGTVVDLVIEKGCRVVAIDLVGHPGPLAHALELDRYRMLRRAGLPLFPIAWSAWIRDPTACVEAIDEAAFGRDLG